MNALSILLLVLIAAWLVYAVIHTLRHKGCGCSGCGGKCAGCDGGCAHCTTCKKTHRESK